MKVNVKCDLHCYDQYHIMTVLCLKNSKLCKISSVTKMIGFCVFYGATESWVKNLMRITMYESLFYPVVVKSMVEIPLIVLDFGVAEPVLF